MACVVERADDDADGKEAEDLDGAYPGNGGWGGVGEELAFVKGLEDAEAVEEATGRC